MVTIAQPKSQLIYGTDPEFFAGYKKDGMDFVLPPAWFRIYGGVEATNDPKHPVFLDAMKTDGVLIMEDGVAFESTIRPSGNWQELFDRVEFGRTILSKFILSKFPKECDPDVKVLPTINYEVERWSKEKAKMQMCFVFGCDQDFDADANNKGGEEIDALAHPFRYGGGHVHVSGSPMIKQEPILAIQNLKLTAGLAAVAFSDTPDLDRMRTYLYGRPTKYRPQQYKSTFDNIPFTDFGVEYRTPSNSWTKSLSHAGELFKWVEIGIRNLLEGGLGKELIPVIGVQASEAIINCNQPLAKELLQYVEAKL